ncbi:hydantoinase/oxoprolinase family protein [Kyrpidia sp.]|uniref:hydantoinase/oxoprolinase family protein n=1 Tax=Kyrpidia sp. TaxID=2073077 RepID=UPI0025887AA2|nr:hydantoinase/oxoprolinase family protein [Kyrpidia sp.]MCL6575043.1 hydantoinase/oxoprolinase family protein [Kyrpidia sp.]
MSIFLVSSDIGGTFTDTVVLDREGRVGRYKSPTVPNDPAVGILSTLELAAREKGMSLTEFISHIALFAHGTTVATNAMLENRRAVVGLIQTRGFGDTLSIMRGFKSLGLEEEDVKHFRMLVKQPLVVPKSLIAEVSERVDYRGRVVMPLDEEDVRRAVRKLIQNGAEVFAVSLLWSFKNDAHERRIAQIIEEEKPGSIVTLSSDILPRLGEYSRTVTAAINASLRPVLRRAITSLQRRLTENGLATEPLIMQSNGGLCPASEIERQAASTVMSGPVGGVIASSYLGQRLGRQNIVATDMGGTSFDVGLILDGQPVMSHVTRIERNDIALSSVAVRTIGAGSGSIAYVRNGYLAVGPQSAGAEPGPACYGKGGDNPTVADADVVLGYLNPDHFLNGRMRLDKELAVRAIEQKIAKPLGMSVEEAAEGIKSIVDNRMADLIRQMTIRQGLDPSDFTLFAYGGAGPTHAFSYGEELGMTEIVVPLTASVHSAFGILASDFTAVEELSEPMQSPPGSTDYAASLSHEKINEIFHVLSDKCLFRLKKAGLDPDQCILSRSIEMRFRFQIHELTVPVDEFPIEDETVNRIVEKFIDIYEARFGKGSAFRAAGVEMTTFRVVAKGRRVDVELGRATAAKERFRAIPDGHREVYFKGGRHTTRIFDGEHLRPGAVVEGPAVIEMSDTTIVVGLEQEATVDTMGNVLIRL